MRFTAKEDIEAPVDQVFDMLGDFDGFERSAMRRGAEVQRSDPGGAPGVGSTWNIRFDLRGKRREIRGELTRFERPSTLYFDADSQGFDGTFRIDLVALSRNRTRMGVLLEIKPKNLSARLIVQSLKLAKANLTRKFHLRVADFAKDMEDRYRRSA